jgi:hypothetical protein
VGRHIHELEEAWIVHALVREDGLSQVEVAELLGHHKSWVSRRLALLERLCTEAKEELRLGLLSPTAARPFTRLPAGNQAEVLDVFRRESLSAAELRGVVDLFLASPARTQQRFVLDHPRQALSQANAERLPASDPRLSREGNRFARELTLLLGRISQVESRLRLGGLADLTVADRRILVPAVTRLSRDALIIAELSEDFCARMKLL